MSDPNHDAAPAPLSLPDAANLDWLRKQARRQLRARRTTDPAATLAHTQFDLAKQYGFSSWRALKAHVDARTLDGHLFEAARTGDVATLGALLDAHPEKLHARTQPYELSLLHVAALPGQLAAVDLLLRRGLDVNVRDKGDHSYAMHWAAAAGHLDVVRRLADAGGDVIGRGDDHALEVIGWATCWEPPQEAVAAFLIERGARHHIFSAIAMDLADEVRRVVAADPSALSRRMSRNEDHRTPLHFAVLKQRPAMVSLLMDLGADPLAVDGSGFAASAYATSPAIDRRVMEAIHVMTKSELTSADRGSRPARVALMDIVAALALGDWTSAERLLREAPPFAASTGAGVGAGTGPGPGTGTGTGPGTGTGAGALHLMAKRNDVAAVTWLLARGVDANGRWSHWDAAVTPLHLASMQGHAEIVRLLLAAGADPRIRDSKHESDAIGWAEYFDKPEIVQLLTNHPGV